MFKPLLKIIPSLSGNMKISCNLDGYQLVKDNIYECFVNEAFLIPISYKIYDKNLKLNLKNNSFEHDVKQFFKYYSDIFYKTNFTFSKVNIPVIDFSSVIYDSNKNFQFGCQRISFQKSNNNQLSFFAPIYVESLDDIKGKKFRLKVIFRKTNMLVKYIDIHISKDSESIYEENFLTDYIERYCEKIDDKCIYLSSSYKNIYYGINLLDGGFIKVEDNISENIYKKYYTINDFDCILNGGFKRNSLMTKQILSLAFEFNPDKLLSNYEKSFFDNSSVYISGEWIDKDNNKIDFYDFSDNYNNYKEKIYRIFGNNFYYFNTANNIMDMKYPAFNEASSENYKYVNTISKNYNRWKMKYSSDNNPYIANMNFAFSLNQDSLYTYKEFPQYYSAIYGICNEKSNTNSYNLQFENISNQNEYNRLFNEKFISGFFNILTKLDNSENYLDIFDPKYDNFWGNVNMKDNKLYHKGILYDFNLLYNKYDIKEPIDKFAIFVIPNFSYTLSKDYNEIYKEAKFLYNIDLDKNLELVNIGTEESPNYIKDLNYKFINNNFNKIKNNVKLVKSYNGKYVYDGSITQYRINKYYDVNDVNILLYFNDNSTLGNNSAIINAYIDGYKLLDIYYTKNIYSKLFKDIIEIFNENDKYNDKVIFRKNHFLTMQSIYKIYDKLYFSIYPSTSKYKLLEYYHLLENSDKRINVYYKTKFIKSNLIEKSIDNDLLSRITPYYYSNGLYDESDQIMYTSDIFVPINHKENHYGDYYDDYNIIYVDIYNLKNVLEEKGLSEEDLPNNEIQSVYAKFLNIEHINAYIQKLYNESDPDNENSNNINTTDINPLDNIYIKLRDFNDINIILGDRNLNTISVNDKLYSIYEFGIENQIDINRFIKYNYEDCYFYLSEEYINEKLEYDTLKALHFDIVFSRNMYRMNTVLYDLIMSNLKDSKDNSIFKDLYLYHLYNTEDYKYELHYNFIDYSNLNDFSDLANELSLNISNSNIDNSHIYVIPYFNSIYEEEKQNTKIYNDYFLNNIYKCENGEYYRFKEPNLDIVYNISKVNNLNDDEDNYGFINNIYISNSFNNKEEILNKLRSNQFEILFTNLISFYNYIFDNNKDDHAGNFRPPRFKDREGITYKMDNPNHDIQVIVNNDQILIFSIIKIEEDIKDLYNENIYDKNFILTGTFEDIFNLNLEPNNDEIFLIISYNNKYYLISIEDYDMSLELNNYNFIYRDYDINNQFWEFGADPIIVNSINSGFEMVYDNNYNYLDSNKYSLIKETKEKFITRTELIKSGITGDMNKVKMYDNNLITYSFNNHNYGFYIINSSFDNTSNTLNIINENYSSINCVDYINDIPVEQFNNYTYTYLGKNFKNMLPYIKKSNIVKIALNNIEFMLKPNNYKLINFYKQYPNLKNDEIYSYTIYYDETPSDIELLRYFDEVVPYIPRAANLSSYMIYYKNTNKYIENDLELKGKSYIMYSKKLSIYDHFNTTYFNLINNNIRTYPEIEYEFTEYQHYNDNKYYNLSSEFICKLVDELVTYDEMVEYENNKDLAFNVFKNYMYNSITNNNTLNIPLDDDRILFLYKKYGIRYYHTKKLNNKYDLKIKYYLL